MRVVLLVLDGLGIGAAPDAYLYGDEGANTLGHLAEAVGGLELPALERLGLGNVGDFKGIRKNPGAQALWGRLREASAGKDTISGHWEMMGIVNPRPFPTYPEGFPPEVIKEFERRSGLRVLGNRPASGTEIIQELGPEHLRTGRPIVYTSADSVFQIAAHVEVIPPQRLYELCRIARDILQGPHNVCRVIARPFRGRPGAFRRLGEARKDFALPPPGPTVLDALRARRVAVYSVGKVSEIFAHRGFSETMKCRDNGQGMRTLDTLMRSRSPERCLLFANLVDFDTLWGHRRDPEGFARGLREFDSFLARFLALFGPEDWLLITADHGCDPTFRGTDHTREEVPVLLWGPALREGRGVGLRNGFMAVGATVARLFGLREFSEGSLLDPGAS